MWGCDAPDCTAHYARCPHIWEHARKRLRMQAPAYPAEKARTFMALHRNWKDATMEEAIVSAVLISTAYRAHNTWRHSGRRTPAPPGFLRQSTHEAVRGHSRAQQTIDGIWLPGRGIAP